MSEITAARDRQLDDFAAAGWNPGDAVARYSATGIRQFVFFYMPSVDAWHDRCIPNPGWLARIAQELIPELKQALAA